MDYDYEKVQRYEQSILKNLGELAELLAEKEMSIYKLMELIQKQ